MPELETIELGFGSVLHNQDIDYVNCRLDLPKVKLIKYNFLDL